jgi:hypothetical protein
MSVDSESTALKGWVREYMQSDVFLTTSKNMAWDDTLVSNLPDLVKGGSVTPAVKLTQVNIGTLHNHPGAEFNDNSVMIELQKK